MSDGTKPGVGLPFDGGVIVDTTGGKWGIVEMPDGRRVVRDVSAALTAAPENSAHPSPTAPHRRLLGLATYDELANDEGIEAFTQLILDRLLEAHAAGHHVRRHRHTPVVPEEHDGIA